MLDGASGRWSCFINVTNTLVCKTTRDLYLLRLQSYRWGFNFLFFSWLMEIRTFQSLKDFWGSSFSTLYVSAVCVGPPKYVVNQHHPWSTCKSWKRCSKAAMYLLFWLKSHQTVSVLSLIHHQLPTSLPLLTRSFAASPGLHHWRCAKGSTYHPMSIRQPIFGIWIHRCYFSLDTLRLLQGSGPRLSKVPLARAIFL